MSVLKEVLWAGMFTSLLFPGLSLAMDVYWGDPQGQKIQRATVDAGGFGTPETLINTNALRLEIDSINSKMYWTARPYIKQADLDGSNIKVIHRAVDSSYSYNGYPMDMALDVEGGIIYWTERVYNRIMRSNFDGSNQEILISSGIQDPDGLALDLENEKIYWSDTSTGKIQRSNLDGSSVEDLVTTQRWPRDIALDLVNGKIYWGLDDGSGIKRANLDGTSIEHIIVNGFSCCVVGEVEVSNSDSKIYFTLRSGGGKGRIMRANLDGSNIETISSGLDAPWGLALLNNLSLPPIADAGSNQSIHVGQNVELNGSGSSDDNTASEDLLYAWNFTLRPSGSVAVIVDGNTATPNFLADLPGDYAVGLIVTDSDHLPSEVDEVMISSLNTPPVGNAGMDQGGYVGDTVILDGSASFDPDFDPIATYTWNIVSQPVGSSVVLNGESSAFPIFTPDLPGIYTVQLIVNDGYADSFPDDVNIAIVTPEQYAANKAMVSADTINALLSDSVTTKGNQVALGNFLLQVIESLQNHNFNKALKKLESVIERTDGCALRGSADVGGKSIHLKDYINNCDDQEVVYPLLMESFEAITK